MSAERCVKIIDGLLDILDEADKREGGGGDQQKQNQTCGDSGSGKPCSSEHSHAANTASKSGKSKSSAEAAKLFVYFQSLDDIEESQLVQITPDLETLRAKWKESGLVDNDELGAFCSEIGKVVEIETSDDTLQIQWENYDTCWVPALACGRAPSGAKATIPGTNNSWLDESRAVGAEYTEELKHDEQESETLLANSEDPAVIVGQTLRVTRDLGILKEKWKLCELDPNDNLNQYLEAVGTIKEIAEDDDTVNLQWENNETSWIPVQACMIAQDAQPTVPRSK